VETVLIRPTQQQRFHVAEATAVAAVRRAANELARRSGFDEVRTGEFAIVVTEAATNLVKHAGEGEVLLRPLAAGGRHGIELLALDRGPGMASVARSMEDGHSTAGSYGVGMGAIGRMAAELDVYSVTGQGTVLAATLWDGDGAVPASAWQVGAVCVPLPSEEVCGDCWNLADAGAVLTLAVADGLGHGPDAAQAAVPAAALVSSRPGLMPATLLELAHQALRGTRGAAVSFARLDTVSGELTYAGVGNIAACVVDHQTRRHLMSHNGIVGSNLRKVQEFTHPWGRETLLVLHSDGIATRWDLAAYPGLCMRHPAVIAGVLFRDFARQRDDATLLVLRQRPGSP
jgi:anti-sigma regulatory factor (Ser/Thr protein kinase)